MQPETTHLIRESDARDLSFIDDASVHLVCTRPPYGSLKEFPDGPGQLGDIADYDEFLAELEKAWRKWSVLPMPWRIAAAMIEGAEDRSVTRLGHSRRTGAVKLIVELPFGSGS